jgi:DNA replication and repair protein RecF
MHIVKQNIKSLRNHKSTELNFHKSLNIIYGLNGAGKTTILESIAISSLSKSFMPAADMTLINNDSDHYSVSTEAITDLENNYKISINFKKGSRKLISSSIADNLYPKDIIGEMPVVILYPDNKSITFGSPGDRRDFIDKLLSQASRVYMKSLMDYRKILKQRNNLLAQVKSGYFNDWEQLSTWTEQLLSNAAELIIKRRDMIRDFAPVFLEHYEKVAENSEKVGLKYVPDSPDEFPIDNNYSKEEIHLLLVQKQKRLNEEEKRRGVTLLGPQKDEIEIRVNGGIAKDYGSQGQHKSLLIALKFAEFKYLKEARGETPIILLDDIFSELDSNRSSQALQMVLDTSAQAFITATEIDKMNSALPKNAECFKFFVDKGKVFKINE